MRWMAYGRLSQRAVHNVWCQSWCLALWRWHSQVCALRMVNGRCSASLCKSGCRRPPRWRHGNLLKDIHVAQRSLDAARKVLDRHIQSILRSCPVSQPWNTVFIPTFQTLPTCCRFLTEKAFKVYRSQHLTYWEKLSLLDCGKGFFFFHNSLYPFNCCISLFIRKEKILE